ncbi:MAG: decaprenyl-phosphate phosphoribosyltransferase [Acidobacteriota bacterium]
MTTSTVGGDTVQAPEDVQSSTAAVSAGALRLIWISARPEQWIKNSLVLAALVFARRFTELDQVARALVCLAGFVALSSAVYLWNDVMDRDRDRRHPLKHGRPIASGSLSPRAALCSAVVLALAGLAGALALGTGVLVLAAGYLLNNVLYTLWLRQEVILDLMSISAGFLLRASAGAVALQVRFSPWLLLCTLLLSLFLGLCKRRHEVMLLAEGAAAHRKSLGEYSLAFLDQGIALVTASTLIAYAMYTLSPEVQSKLHSPHLPWTIPIVLYGLFRYLYVAYHRQAGGDPSRLLLTDRALLGSILLWGVVVLALLVLGDPQA